MFPISILFVNGKVICGTSNWKIGGTDIEKITSKESMTLDDSSNRYEKLYGWLSGEKEIFDLNFFSDDSNLTIIKISELSW
jgi:hypothetical protein